MARPVVLMACGSFNPPTPAHLRLFEIAKDHCTAHGVPVLGGIVSPVHDAYAKKDLISAEHRVAMLRLAVHSSNWIKVSDWEVNKEGWTKTRYSLQYHQNYINAYMQACSNGTLDDEPPSWMPYDVVSLSRRNARGRDEVDGVRLNSQINNGNEGEGGGANLPKVQVKLLCGADLLESFATPGLWSNEDLEAILSEHGLVVITRSGSNPEKFIYDSDVLTYYKRNITLVTNWVPNEVSSTMIRRLVRRGESIKYLIDDGVISYIKMNNLYGASSEQTIKYLSCDSLLQRQPCITTPSPVADDVVMKSPSEFRMRKDDVAELKSHAGSTFSSKIMNYLIGVDEIDKNDVYTSSSSSSRVATASTLSFKEKRSRLTNKVSASLDLPAARPFCSENEDSLPRKVVKSVITDVSGVHKIVKSNRNSKVCGGGSSNEEDVFVFINCNLDGEKLKLEVEKDGEPQRESVGSCETPKSPRSYDEVVKFIFSEHGIRVISDRETIV